MQPNSFKVSGTEGALEKFRKALLAEPQAAELVVTDATREPTAKTPGAVRVRQPWELNEAIWMLTIHLPAGLVAATAYDWLREWLKGHADTAQVRVEEAPPSSAPGGKGNTAG
jgi:hypothetical protein